jgi:hypothetical protein
MVLTYLVAKTPSAQAVLERMTKHADGFAQTAAGFSFSMLGFLAAFLALFSVIGQSRAFRKYRESGLLSVLLLGVAWTLVELAFNFAWSLQLFIDPTTVAKVMRVVVLLSGAVGMVIVTTAPIIGLQVRAARES